MLKSVRIAKQPKKLAGETVYPVSMLVEFTQDQLAWAIANSVTEPQSAEDFWILIINYVALRGIPVSLWNSIPENNKTTAYETTSKFLSSHSN